MNQFKKLKQQSGKSSLAKLTEELQKVSTQKQSQNDKTDDRFWYPAVDKAGNGYAVIRFLPCKGDDEEVPFVRLFNHAFQGPTGSWYIENSLTTIGKQDPVSEYNTQLWNSGIEANKEIARKQKRKLTFISNIYVITDQQNPENEGKVFLFKYGKKVFDKLDEAMNPQFEDEEPLNPFDLWTGADFKLKIRNVEGYRNYDKSEFSKPAPLFDDDSKMEAVWSKAFALKPFIAADQFKSYDELKEKLNRVLALNDQPSTKPASRLVEEESDFEESPPPQLKSKPAPLAKKKDLEEDDIDIEFFKKLAAD